MENPIKMDDLGGKPTIFGNPHMDIFKVNHPYGFAIQHQHPHRTSPRAVRVGRARPATPRPAKANIAAGAADSDDRTAWGWTAGELQTCWELSPNPVTK